MIFLCHLKIPYPAINKMTCKWFVIASQLHLQLNALHPLESIIKWKHLRHVFKLMTSFCFFLSLTLSMWILMSGFSVFVLNLCVCIGSMQFVLGLCAVCTLYTNWIMCGYSKQPLFELKSLESRQMTAITTKQPPPPTTKYTREIILENRLNHMRFIFISFVWIVKSRKSSWDVWKSRYQSEYIRWMYFFK